MDAVLKSFQANKVSFIVWLRRTWVNGVFDKGFFPTVWPRMRKITIEKPRHFIQRTDGNALKGKGSKRVWMWTARKTWNTYANKRVFQTLHGVDTVFQQSQVSLLISQFVRENIEGPLMVVIEHMLTHDVALSRRFITRPGKLGRWFKYAFEMGQEKKMQKRNKPVVTKQTLWKINGWFVF